MKCSRRRVRSDWHSRRVGKQKDITSAMLRGFLKMGEVGWEMEEERFEARGTGRNDRLASGLVDRVRQVDCS